MGNAGLPDVRAVSRAPPPNPTRAARRDVIRLEIAVQRWVPLERDMRPFVRKSARATPGDHACPPRHRAISAAGPASRQSTRHLLTPFAIVVLGANGKGDWSCFLRPIEDTLFGSNDVSVFRENTAHERGMIMTLRDDFARDLEMAQKGSVTMTLRDDFTQDLEMAGLSDATRRCYLASVEAFLRFHERSPSELGQQDVRCWVRKLADHRTSPGRVRQHLAALRFLFVRTLGKPAAVSFLAWPAKRSSLPVILTPREIATLLAAVRSITYRTFFATLYATGLRMEEARLLTTGDIDAARGVVVVRNGKGGRQRLAMLSPRLLALLRAYWSLVRPPAPWLFASGKGGPLSAGVARRALQAAAKESGLAKRVTPHSFRHAFATHMLESGGDIRVIQAVLGHASIRSTVRYARVSTSLIARARSPFDDLSAAVSR
jgi:integrase/recombinase XerD